MFKYTKRLFSDIRFWCREIKIRRAENAEWERTEEEDWYSYRSGHGYYKTILHNRRRAQTTPRTRKTSHAMTRFSS